VTIVTADMVFAEDRWQHHHGFVMQGGRILAAGEPADLVAAFPDHEEEDWGQVAVLPGTVNGHGHSFQSLLRGRGEDLSFMSWRDLVLYPFSERLDREGIAYSVVDIEQDPTAAEFVMSVNGGNQTVPTVRFPDGTTLTNPTIIDVKAQLETAACR